MPIQFEWVAEKVFYIRSGIILLFCCMVFTNVVNVYIMVHSVLIYYYIIWD